MPITYFSSLIGQYGLQAKNCRRLTAKSTHHESLQIRVPKKYDNVRFTYDSMPILVKCNARERLYLIQEECLLVYDSNAKLSAKYRICGVHPIREGAFGQRISRAVTLVQNEQLPL